jgi:hypothetical protein
MHKLAKFWAFVVGLGLTVGAAHASLTGTSVTGQLLFSGNPPNYFDPANGFVPAGFLNTSGPTVTISTTVPEFGYQDSVSAIRADFGSSTLLLNDIYTGTGSSGQLSATYKFTDAAFAGLAVSTSSDTFLNGGTSPSLVGTTLTIVVPAFVPAGNYNAVYVFVPEPGFVGAGSAALLLLKRRRR